MTPTFTTNSATDSAMINSKLSSNLSCRKSCSRKRAYGANRIIRQSSHARLLTLCMGFGVRLHPIPRTNSGTPFHNSVQIILSLCAEKEVGGVTTGRVITPMKHANTRRNRSKDHFISDTVRECERTIPSDVTITAPYSSTLPYPTITRLVNLRPKPCNGVYTTSVVPPRIKISRCLPTTTLTEAKWYTVHADASNQVLANPRPFVAVRGLLMPNYTTNGA